MTSQDTFLGYASVDFRSSRTAKMLFSLAASFARGAHSFDKIPKGKSWKIQVWHLCVLKFGLHFLVHGCYSGNAWLFSGTCHHFEAKLRAGQGLAAVWCVDGPCAAFSFLFRILTCSMDSMVSRFRLAFF